ncbi:MAG: sigma-54 dependent transcriptional regulator [Deltaproteobacteria bacterium]|nr:sigma-54 dependent transcriptional regulator [Deltaproteobacteria bacterium]
MTAVWIVEDDPTIRANLLFQTRELRLAPTAYESAEQLLATLAAKTSPPELLLLDVRLPGLSGVDLVRELTQRQQLPTTIIISGEASISETVEALKLGVHDFIEKPFTEERLARSIRNTLQHHHLERRVEELTSALEERRPTLLGDSAPMGQLREQIQQVAPTHARVLIQGESGTGKELIAAAIHEGSPRKDAPFIKLNCAAIPNHLIEDELFGHCKGAFTDARQDKPGLFEEAHQGTLFLDEIGDMEVELQGRLLRVLEDGKVRRVGEVVEREVDVRVIAATHANLEQAIVEKRFRQDLYFRLAHVPIQAPALRDHRQDVPTLLGHFLEEAYRRNRARPRLLEADALDLLISYSWPGNVRELRALCERLSILGAGPITAENLPEPYRTSSATAAPTEADKATFEPHAPRSLREFRASVEKQYIESVLEHTGWNVSAAARILKVQRSHLHQKLSDLGSKRPDSKPE